MSTLKDGIAIEIRKAKDRKVLFCGKKPEISIGQGTLGCLLGIQMAEEAKYSSLEFRKELGGGDAHF